MYVWVSDYMCVCVYTHVPWWVCGGQRTPSFLPLLLFIYVGSRIQLGHYTCTALTSWATPWTRFTLSNVTSTPQISVKLFLEVTSSMSMNQTTCPWQSGIIQPCWLTASFSGPSLLSSPSQSHIVIPEMRHCDVTTLNCDIIMSHWAIRILYCAITRLQGNITMLRDDITMAHYGNTVLNCDIRMLYCQILMFHCHITVQCLMSSKHELWHHNAQLWHHNALLWHYNKDFKTPISGG